MKTNTSASGSAPRAVQGQRSGVAAAAIAEARALLAKHVPRVVPDPGATVDNLRRPRIISLPEP